MFKFNNWQNRILMDAKKEGEGGGGSGGDPAKELAELKSKYEAADKELQALKAKAPAKEKEDETDLADKARKDREAKESKEKEGKHLSTAIKFNMGANDFIKNNASLLPKSIEGIFSQAEKENYGSEIEKANAIKVGVVSEYFAVQENLDQLTEAQKEKVEIFKKLTKTDKQEKVEDVYSSIFEPTLELARKVKKAAALSKGVADPSNAQEAYKKRMIDLAKKHHLGEKSNA